MSHEILTVKLHELDQKMGQLYSKIELSETASHAEVRRELESLRKECAEDERALQNKLKLSKASVVEEYSAVYDQLEEVLASVREKSSKPPTGSYGEEKAVEDKILTAEYSLDFAMQAIEHALLQAMEAIDAEMAQEERQEADTTL